MSRNVLTIPALVVRQPWAWAIMVGAKTIENRTWTTRYRGPLAIVAGASRASLARGLDAIAQHRTPPPPGHLHFGALLGVVELIDVRRTHDVDGRETFIEGPWCWVLRRPQRLPDPLPMRGRLGLWRIPAPTTPQR